MMILCALTLLETSALYKLFTYLLTYLLKNALKCPVVQTETRPTVRYNIVNSEQG